MHGSTNTIGRIGWAVIAVQVIDVVLHLATGQIKPVRLLSNAILAGWVLWPMISSPPSWSWLGALRA